MFFRFGLGLSLCAGLCGSCGLGTHFRFDLCPLCRQRQLGLRLLARLEIERVFLCRALGRGPCVGGKVHGRLGGGWLRGRHNRRGEIEVFVAVRSSRRGRRRGRLGRRRRGRGA